MRASPKASATPRSTLSRAGSPACRTSFQEMTNERRRGMTEHIKIDHKDHILTLTFARPDKKNAITNAMYGTLADAILAAEKDAAVRVIVLRGEGDMYTAGNDVGEFGVTAPGQFRGERHVSRFI